MSKTFVVRVTMGQYLDTGNGLIKETKINSVVIAKQSVEIRYADTELWSRPLADVRPVGLINILGLGVCTREHEIALRNALRRFSIDELPLLEE